jgi:hypothetical protein
VTLVRLHRKLRAWDDDRFRDTEGAHVRIADKEVRRLGARAQTDGWSKRKLQTETERLLARFAGQQASEPSDPLDPVRRALSRTADLSEAKRKDLIALLREHLSKLEENQQPIKRRTARNG